ncbi:MAG: DUF63 family protein [Methanosphaera sp.]|nr:DUF63 family protein [Methanosphaera sp.]
MIEDFIQENFFYLHPGYTTFNTVIFGLVLGLIVLGILKIFEKIDKNPSELIIPLIPIIFFGSSTRALVDHHVYPRIHLFATPGIYIFIGLMTIVLLILSIHIEKKSKIEYTKIIMVTGIAISIPNILLILNNNINFQALALEMTAFLLVSIPFILLRNKFKMLGTVNLEVLLAHIFDATTTFIAMDFFDYTEQHVLPTYLINKTGSAIVMYPLKIIAILFALYIIDSQIETIRTKNLLKLSIFILGLAPAIRNCLTLIISII